MKDITPILKSLGLTDSEIKIYLAALEHGAGTAIDLSKLARVSRQGVYLAIEDLTKRGIMTSVVHGKKRLYSAEHPSKLLAYARRQEVAFNEHIKDLERSIPELELQMGGEHPVVKVYEGKEGVRAIVEEMKEIVKGKEYLEMADLEPMYKAISIADLKPLRDALDRLNTKSKCIYIGKPITHRPNIERYFLPKEFGGFKSNVTIYNDKIFLVTFEGKMTSLIIESKLLAQTLRTLFLIAFETAKKYPSG